MEIFDCTTEPKNETIRTDGLEPCTCRFQGFFVKKWPFICGNEILDAFTVDCESCGYNPSMEAADSIKEAVTLWNENIKNEVMKPNSGLE